MCRADVHRTVATAAFAEPMCTEPWPQQQLQSRCAQNHSHSNIVQTNVAVAKVLFTSSLQMLLWLRFGNVYNYKNLSEQPTTFPGNHKPVETFKKTTKNTNTFKSPNTFRGGFGFRGNPKTSAKDLVLKNLRGNVWITTESKHLCGKCLGT